MSVDDPRIANRAYRSDSKMVCVNRLVYPWVCWTPEFLSLELNRLYGDACDGIQSHDG